MTRYIQGEHRTQSTLLPELLDDYVTEQNPVRVIDVFVDELDLGKLGFSGAAPAATGRPAYHPAVLLKIYIYGYLNRIQSSRRLEREAQRNVEVMWLTGRLAPDFKTIANFRKDNGTAIRHVSREFVLLCKKLDLFRDALVAIDGSKFKAVNNRDHNFTGAKMKRRIAEIEASISQYLTELDTADRQEPEIAQLRKARLQDKIATLKKEMQSLQDIAVQLQDAPDKQISLTDPDARSMKTRGTGIVGYNVQTAVDARHHLIVAHEVTNIGSDREQLSSMAEQARTAMGTEKLIVIADRGYFKSEEILACDQAGITTIVAKSDTSAATAHGRFSKDDFIYDAQNDEYRCPAGQRLIWRFTTTERELQLHRYWSSHCKSCLLKEQCTPGPERRITRWENEDVLEAMQSRLDHFPEAMRIRRQTVEHPFGTIKLWMGSAHFLMKTLKRVKTEMSLHVLAYNLKRVMRIIGIGPLMQAMRAG
ncbi:IS1182 family transposase [Undibacterium terreum]|uniref:DDE transposase n=1 Tax=Undibacterium terreum TaxID=1224302 RepID=A0A916U8V4_9BURK|nr:IS1182 family transposase [Undibacterium terreum]GGC64119.1 DDE transposase [Undibacterium terreum]